MRFFSPQINNFLREVGADTKLRVAIVPKSRSSIREGDLVFFRYRRNNFRPAYEYDLVLVVSPVIKSATTGNLLFTGFKVPLPGAPGEYTPDSLEDLYNNKTLPKENYRTYNLSHFLGVVNKISKEDNK